MQNKAVSELKFLYHTDPTDELLSWGASLVCDVSQATGFPDLTAWTREALYEHTRERQERAYQTIIVTNERLRYENKVVAHSLLIPAPERSWGGIPDIAGFLQDGILAEAGSTAVHLGYQKLGIAKTMRTMRMATAYSLGLIVCVGVWEGCKSRFMYENSEEWYYLGEFLSSKIGRPIHRYIESRVFT